MSDIKYCYPNSSILKNKLNIIDKRDLFKAERELTFIRKLLLLMISIRQQLFFAEKIAPGRIYTFILPGDCPAPPHLTFYAGPGFIPA